MHKLLLIDDDNEVLLINRQYFTRKGYEVRCAPSAREGLAALAGFPPDCILLDVMMPQIDGFEACRRIREKTDAPILFLTGKLDEESKVKGLLTGGDDYIAKPYGLAELEARIIANIRRSHTQSAPLSFPPLEINVAAHQAILFGEPLGLTNREYELLHLLAVNANRLVTFEQISTHLWGSYRYEDRSSVMVGMSRLRKKLNLGGTARDFIETEWGKGYTFVYNRNIRKG